MSIGRKNLNTAKLAIAIVIATASGGCGGNEQTAGQGDHGSSPSRAELLATLESPRLDTAYDTPFYVRLAQENEPLWREAVSRCNDGARAQLPNCRTVASAAFAIWMNADAGASHRPRASPNSR